MRVINPFRGAALAALAVAAGASAAEAASPPPPPPPPPPPSFSPSPRFTSGDTAFEFKVRGRVQVDAYSVQSDYQGTAADEDFQRTASRRVRLGAEGKMSSKFRYRAEIELNRGTSQWQDLFLEYVGKKGSLVLGNQKTIAVLDEVTSDPVNLFNERAAYANAFALGERRFGLTWKMAGPQWTFDVGAFGDSINTSETPGRATPGTASSNGSEAYAIGARGTYAPIFEVTPSGAHILHLGAGIRYRDQRDDALLNYSARPAGSNFANAVLNTGLQTGTLGNATAFNNAGFIDDTTLWGEFAYIRGPIGVHAEYATLNATQFLTGRDYTFQGGFVDAFWQITGESRTLRQGEFRRLAPKRPLDQGGPGLWQVGVRYDVLDLKDGGGACITGATSTAGSAVCGGVQSTVGAVVAWQPVEFVKFSGQYATSDVRGGNVTATTRRDGSSDVLQFRAQYDF